MDDGTRRRLAERRRDWDGSNAERRWLNWLSWLTLEMRLEMGETGNPELGVGVRERWGGGGRVLLIYRWDAAPGELSARTR